MIRKTLGCTFFVIGLGLIAQAISNLPIVLSPDFDRGLRDFDPFLVKGLILIQLLFGVAVVVSSIYWTLYKKP